MLTNEKLTLFIKDLIIFLYKELAKLKGHLAKQLNWWYV